MKSYPLSENLIGLRLDKAVSRLDETLSRNRIQQLIAAGEILVNEEVTKANYRLKENDVIIVNEVENENLQLEPIIMELDIVYEDSDLLVVNKAKGLVVHPGAGNYDYTLVHGLLAHCDDLSAINGVYRPGIVHRIDKDTSGLLVVAKNDSTHLSLSQQLQKRTMNRTYICLVHGVIEHDYGTVEAPIGRDEKDRKKMAVTSRNSKPAVTHFRVLERFKAYSLLECELESGRTHQIRVHMKYINHPIVGDEKYAGKNEFAIKGQLLHARQLKFIHPSTGREMIFEAALPQEFQDTLASLRRL